MWHDRGARARITRRHAILAGLAAIAAGFGGTGPSEAASAAESYVSRVGEGVLKAANAGSVSSFRSLLRANADIAQIALFSLGPYRKNLPSGRRQEYYRLVEDYISGVFAAHSAKLKGQGLTVSGSRDASDSVIVTSSFQATDGRKVPVTWRLIKRGGGFKVFDVNVEGIWLATTQKTNFISVLKKNNGNFDALLAYLRQ
jgi:phospholipid transport system substrate-binding protein